MAVPLAVLGMFLVIELLSNNWMEPWLYGSSTGVSEVAILIAAVFWTWLWGTPGLLLATPLPWFLLCRWAFGWLDARRVETLFRQFPDALGMVNKGVAPVKLDVVR